MIYVTGDVHNHIQYGTPSHRKIAEPGAALKYARIANEVGVKVTFFVTGRAVLDDELSLLASKAMGNVDFGGHGWDSFCNPKFRTALWCATGSRHGPRKWQAIELARTLRAFEERLGFRPISWRNHAYYTDENTYDLLSRSRVRVVSDRIVVHPFDRLPWAHQTINRTEFGLWSLPINTFPDHDSLVHGEITQAAVDRAMEAWKGARDLEKGRWGHRYIAVQLRRFLRPIHSVHVYPWSGEILYAGGGMQLYPPKCWEEMIMKQIEERMSSVGFAGLLLHPGCMEALDEMATLRRILKFCSRFSTGFVGDIADSTS